MNVKSEYISYTLVCWLKEGEEKSTGITKKERNLIINEELIPCFNNDMSIQLIKSNESMIDKVPCFYILYDIYQSKEIVSCSNSLTL